MKMGFKRIIVSLSCLVLCTLTYCSSKVNAFDSKNHDQSSSTGYNEKFKILGAFGYRGKSHVDVFLPILEELSRRGHDVTVISYFPRTNKTLLPNYRDISLLKGATEGLVNGVDLRYIKHSATTLAHRLMALRSSALTSCEENLSNVGVRELIKSNETFDVILTEGFNSDCFLGFVHRSKAPFISLSSCPILPWINRRTGNNDNPSYVPVVWTSHTPKMTFLERLSNVLHLYLSLIAYDFGTGAREQEIVEKVFGPGVPPLGDIARNTSAVLVNTHYTLHGLKPDLPNIVEVGGIHISKNVEALPDDLQRFLDDAHDGVLYFSLGSMIKASSMPENKLRMFVEVIRKLPRRVIWKWEADDMPEKPKNLLLRKWLPQAAILRHPNVKCYMAHGGLLGVSEGVQAGVPMVIIPMYGDQFHNAAAARSRGVAEVLEWEDITEDVLRTALDKIFNDTRYGTNAKALSRAYLDRPETPLETAVWWTEYIARANGNPYLKNAAQDLTWYQYYLLDVALFVVIVVMMVIYGNYKIAIIAIAAIKKRWNVVTVKAANGIVKSGKKIVKRD